MLSLQFSTARVPAIREQHPLEAATGGRLTGTAMPAKVVQLFDSPDSTLPDYGDMIRRAGIDVEFVKANCFTEEQIVAGAADADAVIGSATFQPFSRNVIEKLERCRFIMSLGIGFECLDVDAATEHGVLVANVPDYCLDEMSDHVMALLLAGTRKIAELDRFVRSGGWQPERASEDPEHHMADDVAPA